MTLEANMVGRYVRNRWSNMELPALANWNAETEETSAGVYRLRADHPSGASFESKGPDIVILVQELEEYAETLDRF